VAAAGADCERGLASKVEACLSILATVWTRVAGGDYEYAVKRAINLVNELFVGFLNLRYPEYMIKAFRLPEE